MNFYRFLKLRLLLAVKTNVCKFNFSVDILFIQNNFSLIFDLICEINQNLIAHQHSFSNKKKYNNFIKKKAYSTTARIVSSFYRRKMYDDAAREKKVMINHKKKSRYGPEMMREVSEYTVNRLKYSAYSTRSFVIYSISRAFG